MKKTIQKIASLNRSFPQNIHNRKELFETEKKKGVENIPVFIINFNRLECLKVLIDRLEELETSNIHIIDNDST